MVLGKLNWASSFVPNFKRLVAPIEELLQRGSKGAWTQQCTAALNALVDIIFKRLRLGVADC